MASKKDYSGPAPHPYLDPVPAPDPPHRPPAPPPPPPTPPPPPVVVVDRAEEEAEVLPPGAAKERHVQLGYRLKAKACKGVSGRNDDITRDILRQMSEGMWGPAELAATARRYGSTINAVAHSAKAASRMLRLLITEDPEEIRAAASATLQNIAVEARRDREHRAAVSALDVLTRVWGLQVVKVEKGTHRMPTGMSSVEALRHLDREIAAHTKLRDELHRKLLRDGVIVVDADSNDGAWRPAVATALRDDR